MEGILACFANIFCKCTEIIRNIQRFSDRTPAQQTRVIIRFLHTGEVLGWFGQTLAGLSSIAACFLVYTGFALAYRRLLQPYLKRRLS